MKSEPAQESDGVQRKFKESYKESDYAAGSEYDFKVR